MVLVVKSSGLFLVVSTCVIGVLQACVSESADGMDVEGCGSELMGSGSDGSGSGSGSGSGGGSGDDSGSAALAAAVSAAQPPTGDIVDRQDGAGRLPDQRADGLPRR
jgi:hypothetical protein